MSLRRVAFHSISVANAQIGGAKSTRSARTRHGREYIDFCNRAGFNMSDIRQISLESVKSWIHTLRESGCSVGTINNKIASIRALAKARGVKLTVVGIDAAAKIGLEQRSRAGTKQPVTDAVFETAVARALALGEVGFAHAIQLERYLGLRGLEALMSTAALKTYANQARVILDQHLSALYVSDGTKGGRSRDVAVIAKHAKETFDCIIQALKFGLENGGYLVQGPSGSGLGGARRRYHRIAVKVGLEGCYSPHSLRYRYCCDKLIELHEAGVPRVEALAFASECLGHGSARTTFVRAVYGRTVTDRFARTTRKQNIQKIVRELEQISVQTGSVESPN